MKKRYILCLSTFLLVLLAMVVFVSNSQAKPAVDTTSTNNDPNFIAYYPTDVVLGNDGILYLFSSDKSSIFRWSISQRKYLETIPLPNSPSYFTYSSSTNRIYLGYPYSVTQIKLDSSIVEEDFIATTWKVRGLATASEFILVNAENATSSSLYYIYKPDGTSAYSPVSTSCPYCYYVKQFAWSVVNQKMYFLNDGAIPEDLYWVQINSSGAITGAYDSPYHGGEDFRYPIRVAPDGSVVLSGSGRIYDATTLSRTQILPTTVNDAVWLGNFLITLSGFEGNTRIQKWDANYEVKTTRDIKGAPIRMLSAGENLVVITYALNRPWFWILDSELNVIFTYCPIDVSYLPIISKPYPVFTPPGIYPVNQCVTKGVSIRGYPGKLTECVPDVEIRANGYMQFNFTWMLDMADGTPPVTKYSDAYNSNMFVTDNLGTHYAHVEVGGAASQTLYMLDGVPIKGWFLFIPAKQGATTFVFHDNDQGILFDNIVLPQ